MNRGGHFYFRYYIPVFMQEQFGCKEFIYSLKTQAYHAAKAKVVALLTIMEGIMQQIKQGRLQPEQAREVAVQYLKQCLSRLEKQFDATEIYSIERASTDPFPIPQIITKDGFLKTIAVPSREEEASIEYASKFPLAEGLDYLMPPDEHQFSNRKVVRRIDRHAIYQYCQRKHGLQDIQSGTYSYKTFTDTIDLAIDALMDIHQQKLDHVPDADLKFKYDWLRSAVEAASPAAQKQSAQQLPNPSGMRLKEAIADFVAERLRGGNWTDRTEKDRKAQFALLTEWLGEDFDITCLDAKKAAGVKRMLQQLPKNRSKAPQTRGLPLNDALNVPDVEKLDTRTVNEYLTTYQSLFGWAEIQGHIEKSPFRGLGIQQKKGDQNERDAFSREQIKAILAALPEHEPEKSGKPFRYWGTMIAIYTGARLNEIAQLALSDVKQENGIWYFDLNDEGDDKQLKNVQSKRRVPIHATLLTLGILKHVQTLRTQRHKTERRPVIRAMLGASIAPPLFL